MVLLHLQRKTHKYRRERLSMTFQQKETVDMKVLTIRPSTPKLKIQKLKTQEKTQKLKEKAQKVGTFGIPGCLKSVQTISLS